MPPSARWGSPQLRSSCCSANHNQVTSRFLNYWSFPKNKTSLPLSLPPHSLSLCVSINIHWYLSHTQVRMVGGNVQNWCNPLINSAQHHHWAKVVVEIHYDVHPQYSNLYLKIIVICHYWVHYLTASKNITISNVLEMSGHLCCCGSTSPCRMPLPPTRGKAHFTELHDNRKQPLGVLARWILWLSLVGAERSCGGRQGLYGHPWAAFFLFHTLSPEAHLCRFRNRVNQQTQDPHAKASLQSYSISHWVKIW